MIRRSSLAEKYLAIVKTRTGHHCANSVIVVTLVAWEGVATDVADRAYSDLSAKLGNHGYETFRKCGMNSQKLCACQGIDGKVRVSSMLCLFMRYTVKMIDNM